MDKQDIRDTVGRFLDGCNLVYPQRRHNTKLEAACIAEAARRQYITGKDDTLYRFISAGAITACNICRHQRHEIQVFCALYTALLIYLDDVFEKDVELIRDFNYRFVTGRRHNDKVLDHLTELLLEMPGMFGQIEGNIMITSTMNGLTSLLVEREVRDIKLEPSSYNFPTFVRRMTGCAEAYALFMFPPETPIAWKLQALPDSLVFINNGNDILSFYKEQLAGDTINRVSLISQCRGVSPDTVLTELVDEAIDAHKRVLSILAPNKTALEAYQSFSQGYVGFHASLDRYRLHELELGDRREA